MDSLNVYYFTTMAMSIGTFILSIIAAVVCLKKFLNVLNVDGGPRTVLGADIFAILGINYSLFFGLLAITTTVSFLGNNVVNKYLYYMMCECTNPIEWILLIMMVVSLTVLNYRAVEMSLLSVFVKRVERLISNDNTNISDLIDIVKNCQLSLLFRKKAIKMLSEKYEC